MYHHDKSTPESFSLAPVQQGMLFNSLFSENSGVDIEQIVFDLHEELAVSAFEDAWRCIIQRHAVFRTSFHWENLKSPLQTVHMEAPLPFIFNDWLNSSAPEQSAAFDALLQTERRSGFNLTTPPLMRLVLCRLGQSEFRLIWTFHHALLDGRSFALVIKEVFEIYETLRTGRKWELISAPPYREHIQWLEQQDFSKSESYWRSLLDGFTSPTPLAMDQRNGSVATTSSGYQEHHLRISESLTSRLGQLAVKHDITLNTVIQGAWALLLNRYGGETDIVFGTTRAGRKSSVKNADSMIGLFINTVPVRVQFSPEADVLSWLRELRNQHLNVREHEHTPLTQIQQWSQVPHNSPIFESLVVFDRATLDSQLRAQGGAWLHRRFRVIDQTNYPITLFAYGEPELLFKISYDPQRFESGTIARLGTHLETLLAGMSEGFHQKPGAIPLLSNTERNQLLVDWNRTGLEYPADRCLHEVIESQAELTPHATALVCGDDQLTYRELDMRANKLASHLHGLNVGPEVLVGVCTEVSLEMLVALLGVLKAGGAYVPLDPTYPEERLRFMLEDARSPVLLTQQKFLSLFPGSKATIVCLDRDVPDSPEAEKAPRGNASAGNLAYVLYTSGSTGQPKGVMVTHRNILNFFAGMDQHLKKEAGVWLAVTSISFDISVLELFWTLSRGFKVILQKREENLMTAMAHQIMQHGVSHLQCTPSMAEMLVRDPDARKAICSLRQLLLGGEALSPELVKQLDIQGEILNMYGPTETTIWSTVHKVNKAGQRIPIGRPIANTEIYILDQHLQPAPVGIPGELFIGGAGVVRGYFDRDTLTAEKFILNPFKTSPHARLFKTGDRARYLPDGTIEFLGRLDHQIKLRGFRIELGEIESALRQHPGVQECVVTVHEFAPGDTRLVAYLVPIDESAVNILSLRELLKSKLPEFMLPSVFLLLKSLPLTPNGKINRRALPVPEVEVQADVSVVPPNSVVEKKLVEIWMAVLGRKTVSIHDNFFEIGGHSLLAMQLVSQIRSKLAKSFSIVQLYQNPTIHALGRFLNRESVAKVVPDLPRPGRQIRWPGRGTQVPSPARRAGLSQTQTRNANPGNLIRPSTAKSTGPCAVFWIWWAEEVIKNYI